MCFLNSAEKTEWAATAEREQHRGKAGEGPKEKGVTRQQQAWCERKATVTGTKGRYGKARRRAW